MFKTSSSPTITRETVCSTRLTQHLDPPPREQVASLSRSFSVVGKATVRFLRRTVSRRQIRFGRGANREDILTRDAFPRRRPVAALGFETACASLLDAARRPRHPTCRRPRAHGHHRDHKPRPHRRAGGMPLRRRSSGAQGFCTQGALPLLDEKKHFITAIEKENIKTLTVDRLTTRNASCNPQFSRTLPPTPRPHRPRSTALTGGVALVRDADKGAG